MQLNGAKTEEEEKRIKISWANLNLFLNVWVEDSNRADQHSYKVLPVKDLTFIKSEDGKKN